MTAVQERLRETRGGVSRRAERRAAEWEVIVSAHRRDDWSPPEWSARTGAKTPLDAREV